MGRTQVRTMKRCSKTHPTLSSLWSSTHLHSWFEHSRVYGTKKKPRLVRFQPNEARQWRKGGRGGREETERVRDYESSLSGRKIYRSVFQVGSVVPCLWYTFSAQIELLLQNCPGLSVCLKVRSLKCPLEEWTDSAIWRNVIYECTCLGPVLQSLVAASCS